MNLEQLKARRAEKVKELDENNRVVMEKSQLAHRAAGAINELDELIKLAEQKAN